MINASGNVVFTKAELAAIGIESGELTGLKTDGFVKVEGRRGRPAAAFTAESVKGVVESRRKFRKEAAKAVMELLGETV